MPNQLAHFIFEIAPCANFDSRKVKKLWVKKKKKMIIRHFKRLLREKSLRNQWLPKFSTAVVVEPENPQKKNTHKERMDNFFNENPEYQQIKPLIPSKLLRRNLTTPVEMYLIDKSIAKTIAYQIKENFKLKSLVIIEINPGLGLLTEELLSLGVKQIEMMESKPKFYEYLSEKFKNRGVNVQNVDFLNIWSLMYQDRFDNGNRFVELMKNIQPKPWIAGMYLLAHRDCTH